MGQDDLTNWESQISLSDLLNEFEYVSIRELNSISDLKKIGVKARYDLDPVLMVPAYIYKDIEKYPKVKRKYLLLYFVKINKNALNWAIDYAKKKNLDVVMISDSIKKIPSIKMISAISVESWMGYMRAAELVLTNSYHGISYCIATHTNFLYVDLNTNVQTNSRMMNLLQISGLENRIWNSSTNNFVDSIVWDEVERKLDKKRKDSEKYIYKILQGKEEKEI